LVWEQGALDLAPDVEAALREAATLAETLDAERSLGKHQRALIMQHEAELQTVRQVHTHLIMPNVHILVFPPFSLFSFASRDQHDTHKNLRSLLVPVRIRVECKWCLCRLTGHQI
jgi:hypothetical protein